MLGFPLGILSAAGAGGVVGAYELIETEILTAAASSITFSSLATYASTYKHLELRWTGRTNRAGQSADILEMSVNGNAATKAHDLFSLGSSVQSEVDHFGFKTIGFLAGDTSAADAFAAGVISLADAYSTSKNKTARILSGVEGNAFKAVALASSFYGTDSVTSITLDVIGDFVAGSRFSLYGIR